MRFEKDVKDITEEGAEARQQNLKKKKKGLTEKDLDYEEMFDDDNEED